MLPDGTLPATFVSVGMPRNQTDAVIADMKALADPERAAHSQRFFKTAPGEYGDGDHFLGIRVPETRNVARRHRGLSQSDVIQLLKSRFHEIRLLALIMLVDRFKKADERTQKQIYDLYMQNRARVNNWDLVDTSAPTIVGGYLSGRSHTILFKLARSDNLWDRRIAILATFKFIDERDFDDALKIAELVLDDHEDLIHKATGWMLREIGNRDRVTEERFLRRHYQDMPRTMLRYAIEKFPETVRKRYLQGRVK